LQDGIALDLTQAGGVYGDQNFASARLFEGGLKWSFIDDRVQGSFSVWNWEQSRFNQRDFQSEPLEGEGVELELSVELLRDRLFFIFSSENQRIRRKTELGFRTIPQTEVEWALGAGVLNGGVIPTPELNPEREYPGIPETTYKGHLIWKHGRWQTSISGIYSRASWLNFEHTMRLPKSFLVNARTGWAGEKWSVFVNVDNATDEDYYLGSDPLFASNTLVTRGTPTTWGIEISRRF
jgi:iron complex outermembrane receptor protein